MGHAKSVLFWVQHLLGTGHLNRLLAIAGETAGMGARVVVASGGLPGHFRVPDNVKLVQLPPIQAKDRSLRTLVQPNGDPVEDSYWRLRQRHLAGLLSRDTPDAIVTEMFPFGRRKFRDELLALIRSARLSNNKLRVICSLRDVLVTQRRVERALQMASIAREHYDNLLIHSDETLVSLERSFAHAADLKDISVYTGYVVNCHARRHAGRRHGVVVSAGGGIVGSQLIQTALLAAAHTSLSHQPWTIVTGPNAREGDVRVWRNCAPGNVRIERQRPDLAKLIAQARLSISQAGYNTVAETIYAGTPAVLVPFETETEDEQLSRAKAVAKVGLAQVVREVELSSFNLAKAINRAVDAKPISRSFNFDGAQVSARLIVGSTVLPS